MNVYLVRAGIKGPIKIGKAVNVKSRIETLQCGNHEELILMASIELGSEAKAYNIESQLHNIYRYANIRGEWFRGNIDLKQAESKLGIQMPVNEIYEKLAAKEKALRDAKKAKRKAKKKIRRAVSAAL